MYKQFRPEMIIDKEGGVHVGHLRIAAMLTVNG